MSIEKFWFGMMISFSSCVSFVMIFWLVSNVVVVSVWKSRFLPPPNSILFSTFRK